MQAVLRPRCLCTVPSGWADLAPMQAVLRPRLPVYSKYPVIPGMIPDYYFIFSGWAGLPPMQAV